MSHTMTSNEIGPNIRSQDVRYRAPYRDDPNAPVHLESFPGNNSTSNFNNNNNNNMRQQQQHQQQRQQQQQHHQHHQHALDMDDMKKIQKQKEPFNCIKFCCSTRSNYRKGDEEDMFYRDDFNDLAWSCNAGTSDDNGIWLNQSDPAGTIMAMMVWILLGYSALTVLLLAQTGGVQPYQSMLYSILCSMALACHIKTTTTDPGSVPPSAVPTEEQRRNDKLSMCSQCQTFKPPMSHHCRICNRCISKMDHHCPWMNNCVGAGNMKHFFLFLIYTWSCSVYSLVLLGWNYFFCATEDCTFTLVLTQLVRLMTVLGIGAFLFTSSMIMNVVYGLMTGIGTIDRLKKKATGTMHDSEEEPIPLTEVFGIGPYYTWLFPIDPIFEDYDKTMGYSQPQRLLREQILRESIQPNNNNSNNNGSNSSSARSSIGNYGGNGNGGGPPSQMMIPPV